MGIVGFFSRCIRDLPNWEIGLVKISHQLRITSHYLCRFIALLIENWHAFYVVVCWISPTCFNPVLNLDALSFKASFTIHDNMPNFYIAMWVLVDRGDLLMKLDPSEFIQTEFHRCRLPAEESGSLLAEAVVRLVEYVIGPSDVAEDKRKNTENEGEPTDYTSSIFHSFTWHRKC